MGTYANEPNYKVYYLKFINLYFWHKTYPNPKLEVCQSKNSNVNEVDLTYCFKSLDKYYE